MCGIVGYVGTKQAVPRLLGGLKRLEYRGYDSAGLAIIADSELKIIRRQGNLANLEAALSDFDATGTLGIGHTRWATHGHPSETNSHPHIDCQGNIAVVHNGIIENFHTLRVELMQKGHKFRSETDTECLAHLIESYYQGDLLAAVKEALRQVQGTYAIAVICRQQPDILVAARKDSPLILGVAPDGLFVASDIPAVIDYTKEITILENGELVELKSDGYRIIDAQENMIKRAGIVIDWDIEAAEKGGYEDFMLKEIFEQPTAVKETLSGRINREGIVELNDIGLSDESLRQVDKIYIIACGTSLHAGMIAKQAIERWARIATEIDCSSEFRYRDTVLSERNMVIAITQSGETADTLASVHIAREQGAKVLAITNVVGSSITREADGVIYTHAGPEIGVAATKTLVAQITALILLAVHLAQQRNSLEQEFSREIAKELDALPAKLRTILSQADTFKNWAKTYHDVYDFLYLGRGIGYPVAMEGALKLKEISYIHAEGYPAGEMKHGPIALIKKGVPIVAVALRGPVYEKILGNMQEAKAREGTIISIATEGDGQISALTDEVFFIPRSNEILASILAVVPLQLLAYYIAKERGCNVDQPRNLAKSVTVE